MQENESCEWNLLSGKSAFICGTQEGSDSKFCNVVNNKGYGLILRLVVRYRHVT